MKTLLNNKGHFSFNFVPFLWAVLGLSIVIWGALTYWIIFLIRLLRGAL